MKKVSFVLLLFPQIVLSRWTAIEYIDAHQGSGKYAGIYKGDAIVVDKFLNKYSAFVREPGDLIYNWRCGFKDKEKVYNEWEVWEIYSPTISQLSPPPHMKPSIAVDTTGRVHYVWPSIQIAPDTGHIYFKLYDPAGGWGTTLQLTISPKIRPGIPVIGVNASGERRIIAYTYIGTGGVRYLNVIITTNDGNNWSEINIEDYVGEAWPRVAVDEAGYFYVMYYEGGALKVTMLDNTSPYNELWTYTLGGSLGDCVEDPITGNVHFVNREGDEIKYRYRENGDIDVNNWYGLTILLTNSNTQLVSISCYNSVVGVLTGRELDKDTLLFKYQGGSWDTIPLFSFGDRIYVGKSVYIDKDGYAHIVGNTHVSGVNISEEDSIFYFSERTKQKIIILPDTINIPDTGGVTYPGTLIRYEHKVINLGNVVETLGIFIDTTKIDSLAYLVAHFEGNDYTAEYGETLFINTVWPWDTVLVELFICPSDTCWPCLVDSTKFIAYSTFSPQVRDSAIDTTHVIIDVVLKKEAITPEEGEIVEDTIKYRIILEDTFKVHIDSLTVYDPIDSDLDTLFVERSTAINDTYYVENNTLYWTIWNQRLPHWVDTLFIVGVVKPITCGSGFPVIIENRAVTDGTRCIRATQSNVVQHRIRESEVSLSILKEANFQEFDTLNPGEIITYYIECRNDSSSPVRNVVIRDNLDDDVIEVVEVSQGGTIFSDYVEWSFTCIEGLSVKRCTVKCRVGYEYKGIYERLDTLVNVARVWGEGVDTVYSNEYVNFIRRRIEPYIYKTADPKSREIVTPGDSILYRLIIKLGPLTNSIIRDLFVQDSLHPFITTAKYITGNYSYSHPVINWKIDSLVPGDSVVLSYYGFINPTAPIGDSVLNWFKFVYEDVVDSVSDTTVHYLGKEEFVKTAIPPTFSNVERGEVIYYKITYKNLTPDSVDLIIKDTVDLAHLEILTISPPDSSVVGNVIQWECGEVAPGGTVFVWYTASVKEDAPLGDTIPNVAIYEGKWGGSSYTEHYIRMSILSLTKECSPQSYTVVNPGDTISYRLECRNLGNLPAVGVKVVDSILNVQTAWTENLSTGNSSWTNVVSTWILTWEIDTLKEGKVEFIEYKAIVERVLGDSVVNWAQIGDSTSNTTVHYIGEGRLRIDKNGYLPYPDSSIVLRGETIHYYVVVENVGTDTVHQTVIKDLIDTTIVDTCFNITPIATYTQDTIIWEMGNLPPGWIDTLEYQAKIKENIPDDTLINRVFGLSPSIDTTGDSTFHFIISQRGKKFSTPISGSVVRYGDTLTFWLIYIGEEKDTLITIIDSLDPNLEFVSISSGGVWEPSSRTVTWEIVVREYEIDTVWFKAYVKTTIAEGDTIFNYATFVSQEEVIVDGPTIHIVGMPHLEVRKKSSPPSGSSVTIGDEITYTIECKNYGLDTAFKVIVEDTLSEYFLNPRVILWEVGNLLPGEIKDTSFICTVKVELPPTAWGDTIFNVSRGFSIEDEGCDEDEDTTYHIIKKGKVSIEKASFYLSGRPIPSESVVLIDSMFEYRILIKNTGEVGIRELVLKDTIFTQKNCAVIEEITFTKGLDTAWISPISPNVVIGEAEYLGVNEELELRMNVNIIAFKNVAIDTFDVLQNICWIEGRNLDKDSNEVHILYAGYKYGVEVSPDTSLTVFTGKSVVCTLRVKNVGSFGDTFFLRAYNTSPDWKVILQGTGDSVYTFYGIPRDSVVPLSVEIFAPNYKAQNKVVVIGRSYISEREGNIVEDTAVININAIVRIVNIIVEPDTIGETAGEVKEYRYIRVINKGNGSDVVEIKVEKKDNGWKYFLTHEDGSPLEDTDNDGKVDVGEILPQSMRELLLKVEPPDLRENIGVSYVDTLVIWGISSHGTPPDSVINREDKATVITELKIKFHSVDNYPNPFRKNKGTNFVIIVPRKVKVSLIVFTREGELIKEIVKGKMLDKGRHEIHWDATNKWGKKVGAGVYLYRLECEGYSPIIKKLVVLPRK